MKIKCQEEFPADQLGKASLEQGRRQEEPDGIARRPCDLALATLLMSTPRVG